MHRIDAMGLPAGSCCSRCLSRMHLHHSCQMRRHQTYCHSRCRSLVMCLPLQRFLLRSLHLHTRLDSVLPTRSCALEGRIPVMVTVGAWGTTSCARHSTHRSSSWELTAMHR